MKTKTEELILPPRRPRLASERVREILRGDNVHRVNVTAAVALLGVRGYYRDTMGLPGANDRNIYDDALFLVSPEACLAFNANTDPSIRRAGVAVLNPGLWFYKVGIHGLSKPANMRYTALVQDAPVTVTRDVTGSDTGFFGINIHRGGINTTSSLGCQTIPPGSQWDSFIATVRDQLDRRQQTRIPYLLIEGPVE